MGTFTSEREAAECYDNAAIRYHGKRAKLNFSQDFVNDPLPSPSAMDNDELPQVFSRSITDVVKPKKGKKEIKNKKQRECLTPTVLLPYDTVCSEIRCNREFIRNNTLNY